VEGFTSFSEKKVRELFKKRRRKNLKNTNRMPEKCASRASAGMKGDLWKEGGEGDTLLLPK